ncbi:sulfotransferase family 2 domain-containing protein [Roseibium sp. MB-4]
MIVVDQKVIYIKVPKTGSSTVAAAIWEHYGVQRTTPSKEVVNLNFYDRTRKSIGWHVAFHDIENFLGRHISDFKSFTVLRNPTERIVSAYRWSRQKAPEFSLFSSLDVFLEAVLNKDPNLPKLSRIHAQPQTSWLRNAAGEIEPSLSIYRMEELHKCLEFFEKHLSFVPNLGHLNNSIKHPVQIGSKTNSMIEKLYEDDFDLYEKHFGRLFETSKL